MGKLIEAGVVLGTVHHVGEVILKLGSGEDLHDLLAETGEVGITFLPEVEAGEFVIPGAVGKLCRARS